MPSIDIPIRTFLTIASVMGIWLAELTLSLLSLRLIVKYKRTKKSFMSSQRNSVSSLVGLILFSIFPSFLLVPFAYTSVKRALDELNYNWTWACMERHRNASVPYQHGGYTYTPGVEECGLDQLYSPPRWKPMQNRLVGFRDIVGVLYAGDIQAARRSTHDPLPAVELSFSAVLVHEKVPATTAEEHNSDCPGTHDRCLDECID
ncbi:hypothetical protein AAVH_14800 [Aphelenchoides avenae]|nr:hypothetical protein AAVH_14800 [Aphelenchus avenae]